MVSLVTEVEKENRLRKVREKRQKRGKMVRALGRRKKGADQRWKGVKAVTFYSEDMKHRHTSVTGGDCDAQGCGQRRGGYGFGSNGTEPSVTAVLENRRATQQLDFARKNCHAPSR